jgi:trk system potassium uptake protein TrkH
MDAIDSIFASTSAVSVTGVTLYQTLTQWSYFGKTVLMVLIEIGGLGFMTFWVLLYYSIIGKPDLKQRMAVSKTLNITPEKGLLQHVWAIIKMALIIQLVGAILLAFPFIQELGWLEGLYYAVFHSISAFTNAGLDLFSNSLVNFQENSYVLIVIMLLIMAGGLGFIVWGDLLDYPKTKELRIYTKLVLITTGILWLLGMVLFWVAERGNGTFDHLTPGQQVLNYLFLSVTMRSSGFANINVTTLSMPSILLASLFTFIGASSGSTGGGIKVSTLAVIFIVIVRSFQGKKPIIFNRKITDSTARNAFFIFTVAILLLAVGTFTLSLTETLPEGFGMAHVFTEIVSALGSVGLSLGLTPYLSGIGKVIIILYMLIGRVGIMTFLWSLVGEKRESRINHPEIDVIIG